MTRVTNNMMIRDFKNNYNRSQGTLNKYMNQLSTGKRMQNVSDDPLSATKSLSTKSTIKYNEQHTKNVQDGIKWLETTDMALDDVGSTLRQARDLAVQGATDSATPADKAMIAKDVRQLREHLVEVGNTTYDDRYIFNGTRTDERPYTAGDSTNPDDYFANDADVSEATIYREVGQGVKIDINVSGADIGDEGFSKVLADLKKFEDALNGEGDESIQDGIANIDDHIEETLMARARVGARQQRMGLLESRLEAQKINHSENLSDIEDVDMAETITNLKMEENVHRASLAIGARVIQPTLVDFLS
ncbi:flagellar hook-associated protein FlgL [Natroniella acetigena]|uniref:flagellar hook-associated protein FlgL n=1 Tax=Natroniella acetigena TaxID=52004 RepID=UPI00200B9A04|nr:flagellar hook-associated protein FlgL [Natroniella acetigena]MCK8827020.1 flagellar hook-associated protein FlgL [Natroniella acetigena]